MKPKEVERLYGLFGHQVYLRCLHLLKEETAAMDALQDVYLTLLDRFLSFSHDSKARAWLLKTATHRSIDELRKRKVRRGTVEYSEQEAQTADYPYPKIEELLHFRSLLARFDKQKLPLVVGYFLEGKTAEEVAQESGASLSTVRRAIQAFLDFASRSSGKEPEEKR